VRRNLEALIDSDRVETAFGSVLEIERSLVGLVDTKSRSSPVLVFRDESNEFGGFELIVELVTSFVGSNPRPSSAQGVNVLLEGINGIPKK
jgi:hypothetical protein